MNTYSHACPRTDPSHACLGKNPALDFAAQQITAPTALGANLGAKGPFLLRPLNAKDTHALADYFAQMSAMTREYFAPHPLNERFANTLCKTLTAEEQDLRLVLASESASLHGYFILQLAITKEEIKRYLQKGIDLQATKTISYAPSLAENLTGLGLGSEVFSHILTFAKKAKVKQIVLMGGVQERNQLAVGYYKKLGFEHVGGYQTQVNNLDMILRL